MDFTGVYHRTTEQMSYSLNESELIVNLKTGYDVKRVFLYYGDPLKRESWRKRKVDRSPGRDCLQKTAETSDLVDHNSRTEIQALQVLF